MINSNPPPTFPKPPPPTSPPVLRPARGCTCALLTSEELAKIIAAAQRGYMGNQGTEAYDFTVSLRMLRASVKTMD